MEAHFQRKALAAQRPPYLSIYCLNDLPQSLLSNTTSDQKLEAEKVCNSLIGLIVSAGKGRV